MLLLIVGSLTIASKPDQQVEYCGDQPSSRLILALDAPFKSHIM
jgi:hypothetical protein